MYQVIILKPAEKEFKKLNKRFQDKVLVSLRSLETNPFLGEKMSGVFLGSFRVKIPPVRIIYTLDHKSKIITVKAIGYRQGIYN